MPKLLSGFLLFLGVSLAAILFGQLHLGGKAIGERIAQRVNWPASYDIVSDTKNIVTDAAANAWEALPPAVIAMRQRIANWIKPEVNSGPTQLKPQSGVPRFRSNLDDPQE